MCYHSASTNQLVGLEPGGREVFSIRGLTKVIARLSVLKLSREVDLRVRAIDDSIYYSTNCTWNRYLAEVVKEESVVWPCLSAETSL